MSCDASAECLNVRPHGALRSIAIMVADGRENGFVLLLEAAVVIRRGKRNKPKAQRPLVELSHYLSQLEVFCRIGQDEMKFTVKSHEGVNIARGNCLASPTRNLNEIFYMCIISSRSGEPCAIDFIY